MKIALYVTCLSTILLVTACTPYKIYHPNKSAAEQAADKYDCEQLALQKTRAQGYGNNPLIVGDNERDCMTRKYGYTISR